MNTKVYLIAIILLLASRMGLLLELPSFAEKFQGIVDERNEQIVKVENY